MTPTQIARRSDALYADGSCGMTRRVLCDMVAQRESDLEDARAEFDKMDKWHSAELQAAMAENIKLRKLVKDMWPHVRHRSRMCEECDLPCDTSDERLLYEPMRQRMSELGVEVDE